VTDQPADDLDAREARVRDELKTLQQTLDQARARQKQLRDELRTIRQQRAEAGRPRPEPSEQAKERILELIAIGEHELAVVFARELREEAETAEEQP
jgi:cell division protein FtsB